MTVLRKTAWIAIAMLLHGSLAIAQLNESDTARFQIRAGASGAWQQGNVELLLVRGRLDLVSDTRKPLVFKTQNNSLYQAFGRRKADNDINSRNFLYWKPQAAVYPFALGFVQTNFRRQIDYRWFGGMGATWQLLQKPAAGVKFSAAMVRERTQFRTAQFNEPFYNGRAYIALWRGTAYVSGWHKWRKTNLGLFYTAYWQPGFDQVPNNRVQVDAGIDFPVWKGLNIQAAYLFQYEQVVADRVRQTDRLLTFGVNYQHKK